jgi:hypothetical protein
MTGCWQGVGNVTAALTKKGMMENVIIVFTAELVTIAAYVYTRTCSALIAACLSPQHQSLC